MKRSDFTQQENAAYRAFSEDYDRLVESSAEAEAVDAGFDAGEFSGPAHATMFEREVEDLLRRHAENFSVALDSLESMYIAAINGDLN